MCKKCKKGCKMDFKVNFEEVEYIADIIKIFFIILYTYYTNLKIVNERNSYNQSILTYITFIIITVVCKFFKGYMRIFILYYFFNFYVRFSIL